MMHLTSFAGYGSIGFAVAAFAVGTRAAWLNAKCEYSITPSALGFVATCILFVVLLPVAIGAAEPETVEIFEHYGTYTLSAPPPDMHPLILRVPEDFRYGLSKGATRNWGLNILTYYPSFTSPAEPENAKYGLNCAGFCNGRILIAVNNRTHSVGSPSQYGSANMGDFIAGATLKWKKTPPYPPNVHVSDLASLEGFDEGFERITTKLEDAPNIIPGHFSTRERFYFKQSPDGIHYDLAATCNDASERSTCVLHFSLACNPAAYVTVNGLDARYLSQSTTIKEKVDNFVSSMIKEQQCQH
jgi:hypothetical protein